MGRRSLLLLAALVIAALGTTGVFLYVDGVDARAQAGYEVVEVLVATTDIPLGTTAGEAQGAGALERRPFLRTSVEGLPALSDISALADKVALATIPAGTPVVESQFGAPGETSRLPIPEGKLAVSVELPDPARVAGFVGPGSRVAVFLTLTAGDAATATDTTRVLLPDVEVIAVGETTVVPDREDPQASEADPVPQTLLTLAVDQVEAQKIVYGSQHGQMYFGLLTDASSVEETDRGVTAENLFD